MRDRAGSSRSSMGRRPRSQVARGLDGLLLVLEAEDREGPGPQVGRGSRRGPWAHEVEDVVGGIAHSEGCHRSLSSARGRGGSCVGVGARRPWLYGKCSAWA